MEVATAAGTVEAADEGAVVVVVVVANDDAAGVACVKAVFVKAEWGNDMSVEDDKEGDKSPPPKDWRRSICAGSNPAESRNPPYAALKSGSP